MIERPFYTVSEETPVQQQLRTLKPRNIVTRTDGQAVNVFRRPGQLFVCTGCCCGHTERGHAAVQTELYHNAWERRKIRNKVHLTIGGCLGPCSLANVAMLLFAGRETWFHSIAEDETVFAIYDYIETMVAADRYLPPPAALGPHVFTVFNWPQTLGGDDPVQVGAAMPRPSGMQEPGILVLSDANVDILMTSEVLAELPPDFPPVRAYHLDHLGGDAERERFLAANVPPAGCVVVRILGDAGRYSAILDHLAALARDRDLFLLCFGETLTSDAGLVARSNVPLAVGEEFAGYLTLGGPRNYEHALECLTDRLLTETPVPVGR